jgi:hypothetical protein
MPTSQGRVADESKRIRQKVGQRLSAARWYPPEQVGCGELGLFGAGVGRGGARGVGRSLFAVESQVLLVEAARELARPADGVEAHRIQVTDDDVVPTVRVGRSDQTCRCLTHLAHLGYPLSDVEPRACGDAVPAGPDPSPAAESDAV